MQKLFEFVEHIGKWRVLVQSRDIQNGAIQSRHIAPGAITPDKIAPETIPMDAVLKDFILPWFDIETGTDGQKYLVAYYADDGAIKDIGMDEATGEIYVILTDGDSTKEHEDGWEPVEYLQDRRVMVSRNLTNEICPVELPEGGECTVVYENVTQDQDFTVSISSSYKTPDGDVVELTVPRGGYAEVSWLKTGGIIYVRGI